MEFRLVWLQNLTDDREPNLTTRQLEVRVCVCVRVSFLLLLCLYACPLRTVTPHPLSNAYFFFRVVFLCVSVWLEREERERERNEKRERGDKVKA
jgi:hypothetical protein